METVEAENEKLKNEVSKLKEDFERLHSIFETTKTTARKDNHEVDMELSEAREQFRAVKSENVYLKEKNETLFKLGKIVIEKVSEADSGKDTQEKEDDDGLNILVQSFIENKRESVKSNPSYAAKVKTNGKEKNIADLHENATNVSLESSEKEKFCHFFSNYGYCKFEKDSGKKCKFAHKQAPLCKFDGRCNRKKCMFSHKQKNPSAPAVPFPSQQTHQQQGFLPWNHPHNHQNHHPQPPAWLLHQWWESMVNPRFN